MNAPDSDDLQGRHYPVKEDMALQRKVWRFERLGWYALVLLMGLTLARLFSKGPLSTAEVRSAGGQLRVEYQRFLRNGSSDGLVVHLQGQAREPLEVEINGELLRGFNIEMLQPQPLKASTAGEGVKLWVLSDFCLSSATGALVRACSRHRICITDLAEPQLPLAWV